VVDNNPAPLEKCLLVFVQIVDALEHDDSVHNGSPAVEDDIFEHVSCDD
jgi:hypothetical protein